MLFYDDLQSPKYWVKLSYLYVLDQAMSNSKDIIIYVPGMKPKPPIEDHRATLWKCMLEGVRRADRSAAQGLALHEEVFQLIGWTSLFYSEQRDLALDLPGVERLLRLDGPEARDVREALHWHKRIAQFIYLMSDAFPILIDLVANPDLKATLQDSRRYFRNEHGVATEIRKIVSDALDAAWQTGRRIMLIGHSLGSVIAYDVLWDLSRRQMSDVRIDHFVTLGSPLGLNFVKHRMLNTRHHEINQYPANIRRWSNLSAVGEMTALDRSFADDYRSMLEQGLVESITDHIELMNYFRGPEGLNVHRCYGYMVNEKTGAVIADWLNAS